MKSKQEIREATEHHLLNIQYLKSNPNPTEEQLEKMYGYLDYCLSCGKPLRFLEPFSHGFEGNVHKFGCSIFARTIGFIYNLIIIPLKLLLFLIFVPFYGIYLLYNKLFAKESKEVKNG